MERVRAFFYVCAGLLCLALAHQLGTVTAGAQSGGTVEVAAIDGVNGFTVASGRTVYRIDSGGNRSVVGAVPGSAAIAAVGWGGGPTGYAYVGLANGDFYFHPCSGCTPSGWQYIGNVFAPTPVQQESWGAMKSRYRGDRGSAQPTQDR